MANKKRENRILPDQVPNLEIPIDVLVERAEKQDSNITESNDIWTPGEQGPRYVVTRGGLRVSDKDYSKPNESNAIAEKEFWKKVVNKWPDGTKIEIVQYDKKKHRVW